jgi:hypothetical protein
MYRTHSIRTTNTSTRDSPRQRRIDDARKTFTSTVGKTDILPATVFRKGIIIVSLKEGIIQEQDTLKEVHQGEHLEPSKSLTTPSPASFPIELQLEAQNK